MRLWLKDSERRPDPAPVAADDRTPVIVGTLLWVVVLLATLVVGLSAGRLDGVWLWTGVVGIVLGLLGLAYTQRRHTRAPRVKAAATTPTNE